MIRFSLRDFLVGAIATTIVVPEGLAQPRLMLNDASRLNPTPVFSHWIATPTTVTEVDVIATLRKALKDGFAAKRPLCISASCHSVGDRSLPHNGQATTLDILESDTANKTYRVHAGIG